MISRFRVLCLLVFLWPIGAAADDATIVIVGDSLSAAYGMQLSESWPSLLQQRLDQLQLLHDKSHQIHREGVGE